MATMTTPVLMVLFFALWTVLLLVLTVGVYRWGSVFAGKAQLTDFPADQVQGSDFYKRAMRAHANCVENLPVFLAVVFAAHVTQTSGVLLDGFAVTVLVARVLQSLVHVGLRQSNAITLLRFLLFLAQIVGYFGIAGLVLMH